MARKDTGFSRDTKQLVLARSAGHCEVMRRGCTLMATDLHHRTNRGMGTAERSGGASAALHVCRSCHSYVGGHPDAAYSNGWLVHRNRQETPQDTWCLWRGQWVLLDDSGSWIPRAG